MPPCLKRGGQYVFFKKKYSCGVHAYIYIYIYIILHYNVKNLTSVLFVCVYTQYASLPNTSPRSAVVSDVYVMEISKWSDYTEGREFPIFLSIAMGRAHEFPVTAHIHFYVVFFFIT